jgi:hypothetical protein
VPVRRRAAAVLAVLAVGIAPGAALAQSGGAGDDQYVDPIGGNSQQPKHSDQSNTTSTGPTLSSTPTLSAQASQSAPVAASPSTGQTLPRTGMDTGVVAAIGLAFVLAGAALRLRLRDERL